MRFGRSSLRFGSSLWALAATLLVLTSAAAASNGLTPHQVNRIQTVIASVISPDGQHIAYRLSVPRTAGEGADGPAWAELHVIRRVDGSQRPFITGEVNVSDVQWTPDSRGISFLAKRSGDQHRSLYVIPIDGGEARRAVSLGSEIAEYSWGPQGRRVALIASEAAAKEEKELKDKGFSQEIYEEDWKARRVYVAEAFSKNEDLQPLPLPGSAFDLAWSPVDDRLAVSLAPTPLVDDSYMHTRVQVVDSASGKMLAKFDNPGKLSQIAWSPDGRHLALISAADLNDPLAGRLMVAPSSGGALANLLGDHPGHVSHIAWQSPRFILFVNDEGVWTHLEKVSLDGAEHKRLTPEKGPALTSLSLSKDGQNAALVAGTPQHPAEVFAMSHGDSGPKRLTHHNPWLKDVRLAPQELVRFKARDGLELEGLLIRPLDERPGQRFPLVLMVHGGPEGHHRNGWLTSYSNPGQVVAARGIAAFYTNYRGSTGRGIAFSKLSQADPAGKEFDDLVDAVDHLIAEGLVDRDKVGVTGGSYGGYATAWCSTRYSDRFAAGVMFVGISNKISKPFR
ncbi:MAG: prolyl oligopeptidase family serine peptidase [Acidobacteriota bacterium]